MEVAVYQPMSSRRRTLIEDVDRTSPKFWPRGPAGYLKIIWSPELVLSRSKIIRNWSAMDDHGNLRQFVNGVEVQRAKSNATREPRGQICVVARPTAIRVSCDDP